MALRSIRRRLLTGASVAVLLRVGLGRRPGLRRRSGRATCRVGLRLRVRRRVRRRVGERWRSSVDMRSRWKMVGSSPILLLVGMGRWLI